MLRTAVALSVCLPFSAATVLAGPLIPPVGPVATTPGPEPRIAVNATNTPGDANSVFKITQPGSYYLAGNVTGEAAKHGVEISASNVSVDLNGFALLGVAGSLDGIATEGLRSGLIVRNGTVSGWGSDGVNLTTGGIASDSIVEGVIASDNGEIGILVNARALVRGCLVRANGEDGLSAATTCLVIECAARANGGDGISGASQSMITHCSSTANAGDRIEVNNACAVRDSLCDTNGFMGDGAGIHALSNDNRIEGNNCTRNDRGIDVDTAGNIILRNTCSGNTSDWEIAADNVVGPILDRRNPASAAISGFSAPDSTGSTHPNANFSY